MENMIIPLILSRALCEQKINTVYVDIKFCKKKILSRVKENMATLYRIGENVFHQIFCNIKVYNSTWWKFFPVKIFMYIIYNDVWWFRIEVSLYLASNIIVLNQLKKCNVHTQCKKMTKFIIVFTITTPHINLNVSNSIANNFLLFHRPN